jgi:hypothetical protein
VKIWDATTGQETLSLKTPGVNRVEFSPDGRRLAGATQISTVKVWDVATGQELLSLKGHTAAVQHVTFSPDDRRLASASYDRTVKVWDAATGQEALTLKGHTSYVYGVVFSPDGLRLASASLDHTVKIWDAATGQECLTLDGLDSDWITGVAFSPDGRRLALAGLDGSVKVWDATELTPQRLIEREARCLIRFLLAKPLSLEEMATAIRRDLTVTEVVRQQALAWIEPFGRSQAGYDAPGLVAALFAKPLPRSDVLAAIRTDAGPSELIRQEAIKLAETYPENAMALNQASWAVVPRPGGEAVAYQRALRQAEAACRLAPVPDFLSTLGVAYYRVGRYLEARATLEKSIALSASKGLDTVALYFLAMCHNRLGDTAKARDCFERAKASHARNTAQSGQLKQYLKEAETVLEQLPAEKR